MIEYAINGYPFRNKIEDLASDFGFNNEDEPFTTIINNLPSEVRDESEARDLGALLGAFPELATFEDVFQYLGTLAKFTEAIRETTYIMYEGGITRENCVMRVDAPELGKTPKVKKTLLTEKVDCGALPEWDNVSLINRDQANTIVECLDALDSDWGGDIGDIIRLSLSEVTTYLVESGIFSYYWQPRAFLMASLYPEKYRYTHNSEKRGLLG
jgi:hypothetical protein